MNDKNRTQTRIAVFLIGTKNNNSVLLGKRHNTGHMDGCWSLVAGHVAEGESSTDALIREVEEEIGIQLTKEELTLVGAMHHKSPPYDYVHFVFQADLTNHIPQNREPHKSEQLAFHAIEKLPTPIEPYVLDMIQRSMPLKNFWVSEYGWK